MQYLQIVPFPLRLTTLVYLLRQSIYCNDVHPCTRLIRLKRDEEKVHLRNPGALYQLLLANIALYSSHIYLQYLIPPLRPLLRYFSPESKYPSIGSRVCLHDSFRHIFLLQILLVTLKRWIKTSSAVERVSEGVFTLFRLSPLVKIFFFFFFFSVITRIRPKHGEPSGQDEGCAATSAASKESHFTSSRVHGW